MKDKTILDALIQVKGYIVNPSRELSGERLLADNAVSEAIEQITADIAAREAEDKKYDELMQVGKGAASALHEMVAALECDYDRLEELRDERDGYDDSHSDPSAAKGRTWADENGADAEELTALETAAGECTSQDEARERIREDALEVTMRSGWHELGVEAESEEFCILLTTGGPAVRIMGELRDGQPCSARLEVQDWFQPWTEYREDGLSDVLLACAGCFYFGE